MLHRFALILAALSLGLVGLTLAGCGDDDDSSSDKIPTFGPQDCDTDTATDTGTDTGSCTQADEDEFSSCVLDKCDGDLKKAFGSGYKSGDFSGGDCSDYIDCMNECTCDNLSNCSGNCVVQYLMTGNCLTSFQSLTVCETTKCDSPCIDQG
ncbi:MAG: hypothetical protein PHU25_11245 [Deltaproteobacteria bacterium]|nr:hypothetical protein [Deltaproteobacteria bacterium]